MKYLRMLKTRINAMSERRFFITALFFMLLFWLPAWLGLFPGTFGYDAPDQFWQYCGGKSWSSHHPVLHTWLMGFIIDETFILFRQDNNDGLAIYTALQGLCAAWALARSFVYLRRRGVPQNLRIVLFLWIALNPTVQVLTFAATKDILFGSFFLCFIIAFLEMLGDREAAGTAGVQGQTPRFGLCVRLLLSGYLTCMMRNQGIYILLAAALLTGLHFLRKRAFRQVRTVVLLLLGICACVLLSNQVISGVLRIPKGNSREMLSVPMNQLAAAAKAELDGERDALTDEELAQLLTFMPEEAVRSYEADTADPVKSRFDTERFSEKLTENLLLYVRVGLRNPDLYFRAFAGLVAPYWNMRLNRYRYLSMTMSFSDQYYFFRFERRSRLAPYYNYLFKAVAEQTELPYRFLDLVFSSSWSVWLVCILGIWGLIRKKRGVLSALLLPALYFGTCLLGPMALLRYLYPMVLAVPVMIGSAAADD